MSQDTLKLQSKATSPVECLGQTFASEDARRERYLKLLAQKLKDPEFRKIEGFPIGKDEDILALSDPPYYTACPNPWLGEFIKGYGTPYDPKQPYHREPFAADVSEGKNHPIYQTHSYHTKVPHRAIMRYILHYTQPGDVVLDGFAGTGMTGVAAQLCGDRAEVQELGYRVQNDGTILNEEGKPFSKLGTRRAILNDLSPAASFIAFNYNNPEDPTSFEQRAQSALHKAESECGWMFSLLYDATPEDTIAAAKYLRSCHSREECRSLLDTSDTLKSAIRIPDSKLRLARLNYTAWSEVFSCRECGGEVVFWDAAVSKTDWQVSDTFECPSCKASVTKGQLDRVWSAAMDRITSTQQKLVKQVPALLSGVCGKARFYRKPDSFDIELLNAIERTAIFEGVPTFPLPDGDKMSDPKGVGIRYFHQFYTWRNLAFLASYAKHLGATRSFATISSSALVLTKMYRFRSQGGSLGAGGGPMNGTLYVPSLIKEIPAPKVLEEHIKKATELRRSLHNRSSNAIQTGSLTGCPNLPNNSADYLFIDPPFGSNIMYSELNFIWESWLRVQTNQLPEAIENRTQKKTINDYRKLMRDCFKEAFRILKPGHWMTVEFSNTKAEIWNAIQSSLQEVGFVVANVSALDKKQLGFNAVNNPTSVKQDLVISAYKPNGGLEERFSKRGETEEGVWDFIRTHLKNLPVLKAKGGQMELITERDPRILYDRMVAF
jgi:DNA modification methylase